MSDFPVRRITLQIEEILHEGGPAPATPRLKAAIMAVVKNPFAGVYQPDLQGAMEDLKPLALDLTDRLVAVLGGREGIDAYGKGAIVGVHGLNKGETDIALERLLVEHALSVNTAAAGGNASLMTIG